MAFSPIFTHYVTAGDPTQFSPTYQHRVKTGLPNTHSSPYQHRVKAGIPNTYGSIFQHIADVAAIGRIRGSQLESPLLLERAVDIKEGSETTSPNGYVRLYAQSGDLRFVNTQGKNVNLGSLGVPLGGIIPWYPPSDAVEPPESFEWADGSRVSTTGSPYLGMVKPALMKSPESPGQTQRYIKGADASAGIANIRAPNTPATGGAATHTHSGTTSTAPDHEHGPGTLRLPITGDTAEILGALWDNTVGGNVLISDASGAGVTDTERLHTHLQNNHNHGGLTTANPSASVGSTDADGSHSHTITSDTQSSEPPYVELAYIIRVI